MSYSPRVLIAALALLLVVAAAPDARAQEQDTPADTSELIAQAETAAEDWLGLIDAGDYAQSWEAAAPMLQEQVKKEQWTKVITRLQQQQLGTLQERSVDKTRYTTQLPKAPAGEYVIVQYQSTYEQADAREVVILRKDADTWKVAGYFARPTSTGQGQGNSS